MTDFQAVCTDFKSKGVFTPTSPPDPQVDKASCCGVLNNISKEDKGLLKIYLIVTEMLEYFKTGFDRLTNDTVKSKASNRGLREAKLFLKKHRDKGLKNALLPVVVEMLEYFKTGFDRITDSNIKSKASNKGLRNAKKYIIDKNDSGKLVSRALVSAETLQKVRIIMEEGNMNPAEAVSSLLKAIETATPDFCSPLPPFSATCTTAPATVIKGDPFTIKCTGSVAQAYNYETDPRFNISKIDWADDEIRTSNITIAKAGTYKFSLLNEGKTTALKTYEFTVSEPSPPISTTPPPTPTTGLEEFLYYTDKDKLNADIELKLGITGLNADPNKSAALESRLPNDIDFKLSMNPRLKTPDWLKWDLGLNVPLKYNAHLEGDQTLLFQPSLDTKLQLTFSKYFQPYAKGGVKYTLQQLNSPILFYENKNDATVMGEGGFQVDIVDEFSISAYMGHEYTWFNRKFANVADDRYTLNSREQIQYAGGRAKLTLEDVEAKLYADASLQGNGFESVTGVPYILPSVNGKDVVDLQRIRAGFEINIRDNILLSGEWQNRMIFGGRKKSGGAAWPAENHLNFSGKLITEKLGDFGVRYDWMETNPMSHFDNSVVQADYTPPFWKKAVSVGGFIGFEPRGGVTSGGFNLKLHLWKFLTNWAEPKKPVPEIDTGASSASKAPTGATVITP